MNTDRKDIPSKLAPVSPVRGIIVVLLAVIVLLLVLLIWLQRPARANQNALALGSRAAGNFTEIVLNAPVELDYKSKADVLNLRKTYVNQYKQLLAADYLPDEATFGQLEDGLPWWGMEGAFYWGSGTRSIEGVSEHSRFLLNPYLLVGADFQGLPRSGDVAWDQNVVTEHALDQPGFPFTCLPRVLRWFPAESRAEVIYNVSECRRKRSMWSTTKDLALNEMPFDLIAYNARDMNMNYTFVSFADSSNIEQWQGTTTPFLISHFFHRGGSCGFPGGCNNMSPATPEISAYWLTALPARMHVKLWRNSPMSVDQTPDMNFVILFE